MNIIAPLMLQAEYKWPTTRQNLGYTAAGRRLSLAAWLAPAGYFEWLGAKNPGTNMPHSGQWKRLPIRNCIST